MTNTNTSFQPLLSTGARIAVALAVCAAMAAAWMHTKQESHRAVQIASTAISGPIYVTLPAVEIVAHRERADAVAAVRTNGAAL